jgi:hypothetical protein
MTSAKKYVVKTRFADGHVTVQAVETDRKEAEALADFIEEDYCDDVVVEEVPADTPVDWDGRTFIGAFAGEVPLYR